MRAAVAEHLRSPLVMRDVEQPALGPRDVLLEVKACGVCYTDLRVIDALGAAAMPLIPGHEAVGVVAAVGSEVHDVAVGARVGAHAHFTCGRCAYCASGEEEACVTGFSQLAGVSLNGGYAEFVRVPASHVIPLPEGLSFAEASPFFCAGLTVFAGLKNGGIQPGQRVVVIGVGGLGHMAIPIATALGAEVLAVTGSADKVAFARARGAAFAGSAADVAGELRGRGGAHLILNTANSLSVVGALAASVATQGTIVLTASDGDTLPIPPALFTARQLRVVGSFFGSRQDVRDVLALAERHHIRPLVETYPLAEVNAAHARLRANQVRYRAVLMME
ncbi:MAG: alcohol dehydrogenase catalytic domain-containing protein [Vicinamibacterales bacterium]